ncbi:hypothetical protein RB195_016927 [Necator americanus]|uniref:Tetraspanin n=1 Tax=Necator americanus TaxID=51031 RepID=A0ABR1C3V0_NECAM
MEEIRADPTGKLSISGLEKFMLASSIIICSIHVRSQTLTHMARRVEKLHGDIVFFDKLRSSRDTSLRMHALVPMIGGIFMASINVVLMHQCFQYGINIASNLCGIISVVIISFLLFSASLLLALDLSRYPNDTMGASQNSIHMFMHVVRVAIDKEDPILNRILYALHEKLKCCGFHSISDYYTQSKVEYPPPTEGEEPQTFRLSNSWIHNCTEEATAIFNSTHICYAPMFCCATINENVTSIRPCPPVRWDGFSELVPSSKMYQKPCAWRIARNFKNKTVNVTILSLVNAITAIANAVHLWRWKPKPKPPPPENKKKKTG